MRRQFSACRQCRGNAAGRHIPLRLPLPRLAPQHWPLEHDPRPLSPVPVTPLLGCHGDQPGAEQVTVLERRRVTAARRPRTAQPRCSESGRARPQAGPPRSEYVIAAITVTVAAAGCCCGAVAARGPAGFQGLVTPRGCATASDGSG